ncbi:MAG: DUF4340 domain-containing protein [Planctomycetota bacterium]
MKPKTTIVLVVLLAVVIAGYLIITRSAPPQGATNTPTASERFLDLDTADVDTIHVERGDRAYTLSRIDGTWTQTEPTRFGVEPFRVEDLLNAAAALEVVESFTPGADARPTLAELDLDPPTATVTLDDTAVLLGRRTIGGRGYATVAGTDTVAVVPDRLHQFVADTSINDLRSRTLEAASAAGLEAIEVAWQEPAVADSAGKTTGFVLRKVDGEWQLGDSPADRVDRAAVADYARRLGSLRISGFIDDDADLAPFGLASPRETYITVEPAVAMSDPDADTSPDQTRTLRIGNTADFAGDLRYATWSIGQEPSTLVFTLRDGDLTELRKTPDDFRDPRLLAIQPEAIASVAVDGPITTPMTVLRDGAAFAFAPTGDAPPPGYAVDSQDAADWLDTIAGLTSDVFTPLPANGVEADATLTLTTTTEVEPIAIRLYRNLASDDAAETPDAPGAWLAVVGDESAARALTQTQLESIVLPPLGLRNRDALDLRPSDMQAITLTGPGWAELTLRRGNDSWASASGEAIDIAAVDRLVAALATLRAAEWLEVIADDPPDLPATAVITVTPDDADATTHTLRFNPTSAMALVDETPDRATAVMRLSATAIDRLSSELRLTELLDFSVDRVAQVTLTRDGRTLTIDQPTIGPRATSGDLAGAFDDAAVTRLLETLAGLEAQRFAPTPNPDAVSEERAEWRITLDDGSTRRLAAYADPADPSRTLWCTAGPGGTRWFTLPVADGNALGLTAGDADAADDIK